MRRLSSEGALTAVERSQCQGQEGDTGTSGDGGREGAKGRNAGKSSGRERRSSLYTKNERKLNKNGSCREPLYRRLFAALNV
jgi:hypothetical protein